MTTNLFKERTLETFLLKSMFVVFLHVCTWDRTVILRTLMELIHSVPLWRNLTPVVLSPGWLLTNVQSLHTPYLWFIPNELKCMAHQQHCIHPPCALHLHPSSSSLILPILHPSQSFSLFPQLFHAPTPLGLIQYFPSSISRAC